MLSALPIIILTLQFVPLRKCHQTHCDEADKSLQLKAKLGYGVNFQQNWVMGSTLSKSLQQTVTTSSKMLHL
jgi:hypothetical protein